MIKQVRQWLYEPKVRGVNVNDNTLLGIHRSILSEKKVIAISVRNFLS
jgi:hypothetical protein